MKLCFSIVAFTIVFMVIVVNFKESKNDKVAVVNYILVEKEKRLVSVYYHGKLVKSYKIALGFSPKGHKFVEGDGKTPEGIYYSISKNSKSRFHLSLKLSYPNESDVAKALGQDPGKNIMIHGAHPLLGWLGGQHTFYNWTRGCYYGNNERGS